MTRIIPIQRVIIVIAGQQDLLELIVKLRSTNVTQIPAKTGELVPTPIKDLPANALMDLPCPIAQSTSMNAIHLPATMVPVKIRSLA